MESPHFVSGFDATKYVHPVARSESRARLAVIAHTEAMRRAWSGTPGALLGVIGPDGDLEALRMLSPRDKGGAMWCVGRHAFADVRLQSSEEAPLRALAVHVTNDINAQVRVIDLQTPTGFFVRGVGQCRDITLTGPALVEMAGYLLILVPSSCREFRTLTPVAFWDVLAHPRVDAVLAMGSALEDEEPVTIMRPMPKDSTLPGDKRVAFELSFGDSHILSVVTPAELRRGVLCGRYSRCSLGGRSLQSMQRVSRVHLLLMLVGDSLLAFDLATTGGTTLNGVTRRYFLIKPRDVVELAEEVRLRVVC